MNIIEKASKSIAERVDSPSASNVTHPSYYNSGKIEVIEAIEDWKLGFHRGNAVKYTARAGKKDPAKEVEDLEKAVWYLKREIENLKAVKEGREAVRPNDMNPRLSEEQRETVIMMCGWLRENLLTIQLTLDRVEAPPAVASFNQNSQALMRLAQIIEILKTGSAQ